jgi:hypothetical protein
MTVCLLWRARNLPIKQVAPLGKVSVPRISEIQGQIKDLRSLGHVFQWAGKLGKYRTESVDPLLRICPGEQSTPTEMIFGRNWEYKTKRPTSEPTLYASINIGKIAAFYKYYSSIDS